MSAKLQEHICLVQIPQYCSCLQRAHSYYLPEKSAIQGTQDNCWLETYQQLTPHVPGQWQGVQAWLRLLGWGPKIGMDIFADKSRA